MSTLAGFAWDQISWGAVVLSFVIAIGTGNLVPRRTLDKLTEEHEKTVTRMDVSHREQIEGWKATVALREAGNQALLGQQSSLLRIAFSAGEVGVRLESDDGG